MKSVLFMILISFSSICSSANYQFQLTHSNFNHPYFQASSFNNHTALKPIKTKSTINNIEILINEMNQSNIVSSNRPLIEFSLYYLIAMSIFLLIAWLLIGIDPKLQRYTPQPKLPPYVSPALAHFICFNEVFFVSHRLFAATLLYLKIKGLIEIDKNNDFLITRTKNDPGHLSQDVKVVFDYIDKRRVLSFENTIENAEEIGKLINDFKKAVKKNVNVHNIVLNSDIVKYTWIFTLLYFIGLYYYIQPLVMFQVACELLLIGICFGLSSSILKSRSIINEWLNFLLTVILAAGFWFILKPPPMEDFDKNIISGATILIGLIIIRCFSKLIQRPTIKGLKLLANVKSYRQQLEKQLPAMRSIRWNELDTNPLAMDLVYAVSLHLKDGNQFVDELGKTINKSCVITRHTSSMIQSHSQIVYSNESIILKAREAGREDNFKDIFAAMFLNIVAFMVIHDLYYGVLDLNVLRIVLLSLLFILFILYNFLAFLYCLSLLNPKVIITLNISSLAAGDKINLSYQLIGGIRRLTKLRIYLMSEEVIAGNDLKASHIETNGFSPQVIYENESGNIPLSGEGDFTIANEMLPNYTSHKKIEFYIKVHGDIPLWPDINMVYPIEINPR